MYDPGEKDFRIEVQSPTAALFIAEAIDYDCVADELKDGVTEEAATLFALGASGLESGFPLLLSAETSRQAAQGLRIMRKTREWSAAAAEKRLQASIYLRQLNLSFKLAREK